MPLVIVVGGQWGDEGKGKVVDYLTENASLVVRFQGGNNAGHTVFVNGEKFALRLIPSGILRERTRCLLASGVVLDIEGLLGEFEELRKRGIDINPKRFGIASEVVLIMPYHKAIDAEREKLLADGKIGTTGKGIGPAYEDSASRYAIRFADLFDSSKLERLVNRNVEINNKYLAFVLGSKIKFDAKEVLSKLKSYASELKPYSANVSLEVDRALASSELVTFEGAQGALLDINHGTYPFVTSSHTVSSFACVSAGVGPKKVDKVIGIFKAYITRVGSGPFPTEDTSRHGDTLREVGREFGTVTGRPRRCGWFDGVAATRTCRLNGIDTALITKLDVLSGFDSIKIGIGYTLNGERIDDMPVLESDIARVQVEYEELCGWKEDIGHVKSFDQLPENAKKYLQRLESLLGVRLEGFSVGAERDQTVIMN